MSASPFFEQVRQQREELRDRLAALEYIAEVDAQAEKDPANAKIRERGGTLLDPVDPTRATMPIVWLRALLVAQRVVGYGILANSPEMTVLLRVWNDDYNERVGGSDWERLHGEHPELADALAAFLGTL